MSTREFSEMLVKHSDFLKPFAINLTRDHEAAKDLCQETIYKALANKEKYTIGTNLKAWLFTIMRNIFINEYRRKSRYRTIVDKEPADILSGNYQYTVNNHAEGDLGLKEINNALHRLPRIFQTPFLLYFEGYHYHEISTALEEPLGTVKSRIHFARKLLKEQIKRG